MFHALPLFCFLVPSILDKTRPQPINTDCYRPTVVLSLSAPGTGGTSAPEYDSGMAPPSASTERWLYPSFGSIVDIIESHVTKDRSSMDPGQNAMVYTLSEGFLPEDRTWMDFVRQERIGENSKVLYRPEIVNNLVQQIEDLLGKGYKRGLLVKGPQGVGKSYSLINLTRYLLASGKYWVTIVPDCDKWYDSVDLYRFLLQSVGVDPSLLWLDQDTATKKDLEKLIVDIDYVLAKHGKQWVFVFDQIDKIFGRKEFRTAKDIGVLPFPYFMMKHVLKRGRIVSIISASANNDVWHQENHEGFKEFEHPTRLDTTEISLLYSSDQILKWDWDEVEYLTGYVPMYLNKWVKDPKDYSSIVCKEIKDSLQQLRRENQGVWKSYVESAMRCLEHVGLRDEPLRLDRKFSLVQETKNVDETSEFSIVALFPLVEEAYRQFFSDQITNYVLVRELPTLNAIKSVPGDLIDRLFKPLVVTRLALLQLSTTELEKILRDANPRPEREVSMPPALEGHVRIIHFRGVKYPQLSYGKNQITYFTQNVPCFPAVDSIIQVGNIVIAFHCHVSDREESYKDVFALMKKRIILAGWDPEQVQKIILVYLSPKVITTLRVKRSIGEQTSFEENGFQFSLACYSIRDFDTLRNIQWRG